MGCEMKPSPQGPIRIFTTRNGRKVELIAVMPECRGVDASQERIIGVCPPRPGEPNRRALRTWKIDGRFLTTGTHDLDLMDIPAEGLQPTVPPTGQPSPTGLPRIQRNCEEIIRQAQDVIARTRLLMLRDVERVPVVVPRGQLTEQHHAYHAHDLEGAAPETAHQPAHAQRSAMAAWTPADGPADWRKEPPLTDEAVRHQLLDELLTPVILVLERIALTHKTEQAIGWLEAAIVVRALHEAGYGKPKEATAAGPPAK